MTPFVLCLLLMTQVPRDATALAAEGFRLLEASRLAEAMVSFESAVSEARRTGDRAAEADALRGVGTVLYQQGKWPAARAPLEHSLSIYTQAGNHEGEARAREQLGSVSAMVEDPNGALAQYDRALALFTDLNLRGDRARVLRNISHVPTVPLEKKYVLLDEAFQLAVEDPQQQGLILLQWASLLQAQGRYGESVAKFQQALPLLEANGSPRELSRALYSLAGAYHLQGRTEDSLPFYERALKIAEQIGDVASQAQTEVALGNALSEMGDLAKASATFERALAHARATGTRSFLTTPLAYLGRSHVDRGDFAGGAKLLEEAVGTTRNLESQSGAYRHLARAYLGLDRLQDAIVAATSAVTVSRDAHRLQLEVGALQVRAMAYERSGDLMHALEDTQAALEKLEEVRTNLTPLDYFKSGFADLFQDLFGLSIELLVSVGRGEEAAGVAEQARARAFLDLLATREVGARAADVAVPGVVESAPAAAASVARSSALTMRGSDTVAARWRLDAQVSSTAQAPRPAAGALITAARRLGSTVVSFWVDRDVTLVWIATSDGRIQAMRESVGHDRLQQLVAATQGAGAPAVRGVELVTRGGAPVQIAMGSLQPYRDLYDALIAPIRGSLPSGRGASLTIIPHGPLFQLSFASLVDRRGRYLVEDFAVHYAPSAAVLDYTARQTDRPHAATGYLLVANPTMLAGTGERSLPPLPGAEREAHAVSRLLPTTEVKMLAGAQADEAAVRAAIGSQRVVHFATHGLVSNSKPLDSFLALAGKSESSGNDGQLTAKELYDLELGAELVVLSACRTAGGQISGDGIIGLTRGFFAAGAPSIVAALWDVPDVSAEQLMPRFYREWQRAGDKSRALRAAQLSMLRDLRAGRLKVPTPFGDATLPPHPALWASFVLLGEP